jgi:hypothetical protein
MPRDYAGPSERVFIMGLKLATPDAVWCDVEVDRLDLDGEGGTNKKHCRVKFSLISRDQYFEDSKKDKPLSEYVKDWQLKDDDGVDIKYNKKNLEDVLAIGAYMNAFRNAFARLVMEHRTKN